MILGQVAYRRARRASLEGNHGKRDAVYIDVFLREQPGFRVGGVVHAPQASANHLFAEKLTRKGAQPEDMRDVIGVPALGQHGYGDDASHLFAGFAGLPDGSHNLPQILGSLGFVLSRFFALRVSQHLAINPQRSQQVFVVG